MFAILGWLTEPREFWYWLIPAILAIVSMYSALKKASDKISKIGFWVSATGMTMLAMTHADLRGPLNPFWVFVFSCAATGVLGTTFWRHLRTKRWITASLAFAAGLVVLAGSLFAARSNDIIFATALSPNAEWLTSLGLWVALMTGIFTLAATSRHLPSWWRDRRKRKKAAKKTK